MPVREPTRQYGSEHNPLMRPKEKYKYGVYKYVCACVCVYSLVFEKEGSIVPVPLDFYNLVLLLKVYLIGPQ